MTWGCRIITSQTGERLPGTGPCCSATKSNYDLLESMAPRPHPVQQRNLSSMHTGPGEGYGAGRESVGLQAMWAESGSKGSILEGGLPLLAVWWWHWEQ